jgi:hypothetical protein
VIHTADRARDLPSARAVRIGSAGAFQRKAMNPEIQKVVSAVVIAMVLIVPVFVFG